MNLLIPIILIHGLGGTTNSIQPLKKYLEYGGYKVYAITYPSIQQTLEESINSVNNEIKKLKLNSKIVVIGQSLGGVICHNLHKYDLDIALSITIGSPHHGASLIKTMQQILPPIILNYLEKPVYHDLLSREGVLPPHPHHTISTSLAPCLPFDGQVYIDETKVSKNHTHIHFNNHWTIFIDPRLFWTINNLLLTI